MSPLLEIDDLRVEFGPQGAAIHAVRGLTLGVDPGQCLGVVGESGCGKSVSMLAVLGLLPEGARVSGSVRFEGAAVSTTTPNPARGRDVSMVFQDSMNCLNPLLRVGSQVAEVLHYLGGRPWRPARAGALELLERVGLDPAHVARQYPHQLSGGMRQRVMLASAIAAEPKLLIADEPTTGLDVTVQAQIIGLLRELRSDLGLSIVFVSHDLGTVAELCDDVAVVYGGRVVERGPTASVIEDPRHPYAQGLVRAYPRLGAGGGALAAIPGAPPAAGVVDDGCSFRPRCPRAGDECRNPVPMEPLDSERSVACVREGEQT